MLWKHTEEDKVFLKDNRVPPRSRGGSGSFDGYSDFSSGSSSDSGFSGDGGSSGGRGASGDW